MPTPGEHKTVQARILAYAQEIGWTIVTREEAERRRGFNPQMAQMKNLKKIICENLRNLRFNFLPCGPSSL